MKPIIRKEETMKQIITHRSKLLALSVALLCAAGTVWAGSAHFVGDVIVVENDDGTLTASGKEAGLGNLDQVHIVVTADALCINNGGKHPKAVNKEGVSGGGDFPVQNGKADFSVTTEPVTFQPPCDPPMTLEFRNISVCDTTNGICKTNL
jgi:hypothetical protein